MGTPHKPEVQSRLKRFRFQIMELEIAQDAFTDLRDTKFSDLWHEFCTETYHARCALQKLQRASTNLKISAGLNKEV